MPWTSKGYDKAYYSKLMDKYGLRGIPSLIVLGKDGETAVSKDGRAGVTQGFSCIKEW